MLVHLARSSSLRAEQFDRIFVQRALDSMYAQQQQQHWMHATEHQQC